MPVKEIATPSAIARVDYNAHTRRLSVWFEGGRRYVYADVSPAIYDQLCRAAGIDEQIDSEPRFRLE